MDDYGNWSSCFVCKHVSLNQCAIHSPDPNTAEIRKKIWERSLYKELENHKNKKEANKKIKADKVHHSSSKDEIKNNEKEEETKEINEKIELQQLERQTILA